jgi:hypothetical protein
VAFVGGTDGLASRVAAELVIRGHPLASGKVLALTHRDGVVWGHPGPPFLNALLGPSKATAPTLLGVTIATLGVHAWVVARRACDGPRPLGAVCLLERGAGRPSLCRARPDPLTFLPHALAFDDRHDRPRARFRLYSRIAATVPVYRLRSSSAANVPQIADAIESRFATPPAAAAALA